MTIDLPEASRFSFSAKPVPVPGDLRIGWRLALILMMLGKSRAKKASLAKLHVLNHAIRSPTASKQLERLLAGDVTLVHWQMQIEPAFARAIDFMVGERFAEWTHSSSRSALQLTSTGVKAFETLDHATEVLEVERAFLGSRAMSVTESFVSKLMSTEP
jgi:hypothetical protein